MSFIVLLTKLNSFNELNFHQLWLMFFLVEQDLCQNMVNIGPNIVWTKL